MQPDEADGVARATGQAAQAITRLVRDSQRHATDRAYRAVEAALGEGVVRPVRVVHQGLTSAVYGTVDISLAVAAATTGAALRRRRPADAPRVADRPAARAALAVAHGLHGDHLAAAGNPLTYGMTVRVDGRDVPPTGEALAAAFPGATGVLVVFLHGLVEDETWWQYRSAQVWGEPGVSYGSLLRRHGVTPVWLRYSTGERVSVNGRALDELLDALVTAWPVEVERLVLVGHSMGGLVLRSALAQSAAAWPERVSDTVTLGTPHHGAPLERFATAAARVAARRVGTRWLAGVIGSRSGGIRDLRHGNLVDDDWAGHHPDDPHDRRTPVPLHPGPRHLVVVGTVTSDPDGAAAARLGDLLVPVTSASGPAAAEGDVIRVGGVHHLALLNHPEVYRRLESWLIG